MFRRAASIAIVVLGCSYASQAKARDFVGCSDFAEFKQAAQVIKIVAQVVAEGYVSASIDHGLICYRNPLSGWYHLSFTMKYNSLTRLFATRCLEIDSLIDSDGLGTEYKIVSDDSRKCSE